MPDRREVARAVVSVAATFAMVGLMVAVEVVFLPVALVAAGLERVRSGR